MKIKNCETTWICQLSKFKNKRTLKAFRDAKSKDPKVLKAYYKFIIGALKDTSAWNISGVNKFVNELTDSVRATIRHSKTGKTSAYSHARKTLITMREFGNRRAVAKYYGNYSLHPIITDEELNLLD